MINLNTNVANANTVVSELVDSEITDEEVDELIKFCSWEKTNVL